MIIHPLTPSSSPTNPIEERSSAIDERSSAIDRCTSIAKRLFLLIAGLGWISIAAKTITPFFVVYQSSLALLFSNPLTLIAFLAVATAALGLFILHKKRLSSLSKETNERKYQETNQMITDISKKLDEIKLPPALKTDRRYQSSVILNGKSLKDSETIWIETVTDYLKKEGFAQEKIENVLKSIDIQIFYFLLEKVQSLIQFERNHPIHIEPNSTNEKALLQAEVDFIQDGNSCRIKIKKGMDLYKLNDRGTPDMDTCLGTVFMEIIVYISKEAKQIDTGFYSWKINKPII